MRVTLAMRYQQALDALNRRGDEYIKSLYPNGVPSSFFKIGRGYQIEEVPITHAGYSYKRYYYRLEKVTRADADDIEAFLATQPEMTPEGVCFFWEVRSGTSTHKGAERLSNLLKKEQCSFCADDLVARAAELKERYTLKEGDIACTYCRRAFPKVQAIRRRIISFANYGRAGKEFDYCSPDCACHDQMAHEG